MKAFLGMASLVTATAAGAAAAVARRPRHPDDPPEARAPVPTAAAVQAIDAARDRLRASAAGAPGARAA
jgi:hypothetical protein